MPLHRVLKDPAAVISFVQMPDFSQTNYKGALPQSPETKSFDGRLAGRQVSRAVEYNPIARYYR